MVSDGIDKMRMVDFVHDMENVGFRVRVLDPNFLALGFRKGS